MTVQLVHLLIVNPKSHKEVVKVFGSYEARNAHISQYYRGQDYQTLERYVLNG